MIANKIEFTPEEVPLLLELIDRVRLVFVDLPDSLKTLDGHAEQLPYDTKEKVLAWTSEMREYLKTNAEILLDFQNDLSSRAGYF